MGRKRPVRPPLPHIDLTIKQLDNLSFKRFESKSQAHRASKNAHRALRYILMQLEAIAKYDAISPRSICDDIHRLVRNELGLEEPPCPTPTPTPSAPSPTTDPGIE